MLEKKVECECPFLRIAVGTGVSDPPPPPPNLAALVHPPSRSSQPLRFLQLLVIWLSWSPKGRKPARGMAGGHGGTHKWGEAREGHLVLQVSKCLPASPLRGHRALPPSFGPGGHVLLLPCLRGKGSPSPTSLSPTSEPPQPALPCPAMPQPHLPCTQQGGSPPDAWARALPAHHRPPPPQHTRWRSPLRSVISHRRVTRLPSFCVKPGICTGRTRCLAERLFSLQPCMGCLTKQSGRSLPLTEPREPAGLLLSAMPRAPALPGKGPPWGQAAPRPQAPHAAAAAQTAAPTPRACVNRRHVSHHRLRKGSRRPRLVASPGSHRRAAKGRASTPGWPYCPAGR